MGNCALNPQRVAAISKIAEKLRGKPLSPAHREAVSDAAKRKIAEGTWHNSFSRARTYDYRGVKLYGRWEVAYARYLDKQKIEWRRPTETFPYSFEGRERRYTPDFYLPADDTYVEIKGYKTPKDAAKWVAFPKKLQVLRGRDLFEMGLIDSYKPDR
jgi:hypothetical protein